MKRPSAGEGRDKLEAEAGRLVVSIILKAFVDARLFGSSLAFKDWDIEPRPKTLTGAVQINMGEVLHQAHEVDIAGTSTFASKEENWQGTFTTFYGLRYGLIGFNGMANEHSARLSQLTDADYERFLEACGGASPARRQRTPAARWARCRAARRHHLQGRERVPVRMPAELRQGRRPRTNRRPRSHRPATISST